MQAKQENSTEQPLWHHQRTMRFWHKAQKTTTRNEKETKAGHLCMFAMSPRYKLKNRRHKSNENHEKGRGRWDRTLEPASPRGTESRIANRTIPRIAGPESPEIPQREAKKCAESQQSRIAENRFRIALRIAAYQCLKRPWNRTIRIARFRIARFPIQNRRFSATKNLANAHIRKDKEERKTTTTMQWKGWLKCAHQLMLYLPEELPMKHKRKADKGGQGEARALRPNLTPNFPKNDMRNNKSTSTSTTVAQKYSPGLRNQTFKTNNSLGLLQGLTKKCWTLFGLRA